MRLAFAALALLAASRVSAQGTGTIAGQILEADGVTTVIGANVRVEGTTLGAATDIDGNYRIIGVPVGTYTVTVLSLGFLPQTQSAVRVDAGYTRPLSFTLEVDPDVQYVVLDGCDLFGLSADPYASRVLLGDDLERMPVSR